MMARLLKSLFFLLIVKPVALIMLGVNVRDRDRFPAHGPAIIAANHNSHLDTVVLMSLFPFRLLHSLRPVAGADYFLRSWFMSFFSLNVIGIIPIKRTGRKPAEDPFLEIGTALKNGDIVILFPEGSRGLPERMTDFKKGISYLAERFPEIHVTPVFLHGLGKALPKGSFLPVPFFCDVFVGEPLSWPGDREAFMTRLKEAMTSLRGEGTFSPWE